MLNKMGLKSKITSSIGKFLLSGALIATPVLAKSSDIYAQSLETPKQLIEKISNIPNQPMARGIDALNFSIKKRVADSVIAGYAAKRKYGEKETVNEDGSVTSSYSGYINMNDICDFLPELYQAAKDIYGANLEKESETNPGIQVLLEKHCMCEFLEEHNLNLGQ